MPTRCFLIEPTDRLRLFLRRYSDGWVGGHYHDAQVFLEEASIEWFELNQKRYISDVDPEPYKHTHADKWPTRCPADGYEFTPEDHWQIFRDRIYSRVDTGEEVTLRTAPPGAMWDADWLHELPSCVGTDGRALFVKLPNGVDWHVDGRANNCTLPNDTEHKCWIRHGEPPLLTVDKNGRTCAAGAGSIQGGDYHGYLRNGVLEP